MVNNSVPFAEKYHNVELNAKKWAAGDGIFKQKQKEISTHTNWTIKSEFGFRLL